MFCCPWHATCNQEDFLICSKTLVVVAPELDTFRSSRPLKAEMTISISVSTAGKLMWGLLGSWLTPTVEITIFSHLESCSLALALA